MKKNIRIALALGLVAAGTAVATVATALPTNVKRPPGVSNVPGVKLTGLTVQAVCGKASTINVTLSYENLKSSLKAELWGTLNQTVEVPKGSGSKTYSFAGPTLVCDTSAAANYDAVLHQTVVLGTNGTGLTTETYSATGTTVTVGG